MQIQEVIHDKVYTINVACVEGVKPFELENIVSVNDGELIILLDQKK